MASGVLDSRRFFPRRQVEPWSAITAPGRGAFDDALPAVARPSSGRIPVRKATPFPGNGNEGKPWRRRRERSGKLVRILRRSSMRSLQLRSPLSAVLFVAAHVLGGGVIGALFPPGPWLEQFSKPPFYPPGWTFPVVWPALYALMGFAIWLVLRSSTKQKGAAVTLYFTQLAVNFSFSPLFFGLRDPFMGLAVVAILFPSIIATMASFYRISRLAAALLAPYLVWTGFALALAFSIWQLNA